MTARLSIVVAGARAGEPEITRTLRSISNQRSARCDVLLLGADVPVAERNPSITATGCHELPLTVASRASGGHVAVVDAGDQLAPGILDLVAATLDTRPDLDVVYTDEVVEDATGSHAFYKPNWSPTRARAQDYVGQLSFFRRALLDALAPTPTRAGAFDCARNVEHLATLGFHRTSPSPSWAPRHRARLPVDPGRTASVVIPTAGTARSVWGVTRPLVLRAVDSLVEVTSRPVEVVVVVDPSTPPAVRRALEVRPVRLVDGVAPFNFATSCNIGVAASGGDDVVLLNDDTLVEQPGWLDAMRSFFLEPDVGVVGARLLYADGTLQHGGILLNEQPLHIFHGYAGDDPGPFDLLRVDREVSAVTGACLATPRDVWDELGGLDPAFAVAFNDLDYCLRVQRSGRRVIWTPGATLYHFESQSRRRDAAPHEIALLYARWGAELRDDPYGNPAFEPRQAEWIPRQPLAIEQRIWRRLRRTLNRPPLPPG